MDPKREQHARGERGPATKVDGAEYTLVQRKQVSDSVGQKLMDRDGTVRKPWNFEAGQVVCLGNLSSNLSWPLGRNVQMFPLEELLGPIWVQRWTCETTKTALLLTRKGFRPTKGQTSTIQTKRLFHVSQTKRVWVSNDGALNDFTIIWEATSNKCIASSNKCLTSSNKKLLI